MKKILLIGLVILVILGINTGCSNPEVAKNKKSIEGMKTSYNNNGYMTKTPYKNGEKNGIEKTYDKSGKLVMQRPYENDKQEGVVKYYLGDTQIVSFYKNDKKEGLEKTFRNGKLFMATPYKNGEKNGIKKTYHNGKLYTATLYKNGKRNGIEKSYYKTLLTTTPYINNERNGIEKVYSNGKLYQTTSFINGEWNGADRTYYDNGKIETEGQWKNSQRIGTWIDYTKKGSIETIEIYKKGRLTSGIQHFDDGSYSKYSQKRIKQTNTRLIDIDKSTKNIRKLKANRKKKYI